MRFLVYPLILLFISCTTDIIVEQRPSLVEPQFNAQAFITIDGTQNYTQFVYLDTLKSYTYTKVFGESVDMLDYQKYNGESNIRASFSTNKYWNYNGGVFQDYPIYYIYPFSVRFVEPSLRYDYQPNTLELFTQQMVGPIPKEVIINQENIKIYMDVSYDGLYFIKDSILIELRPK